VQLCVLRGCDCVCFPVYPGVLRGCDLFSRDSSVLMRRFGHGLRLFGQEASQSDRGPDGEQKAVSPCCSAGSAVLRCERRRAAPRLSGFAFPSGIIAATWKRWPILAGEQEQATFFASRVPGMPSPALLPGFTLQVSIRELSAACVRNRIGFTANPEWTPPAADRRVAPPVPRCNCLRTQDLE
jgi:hypothetical protein